MKNEVEHCEKRLKWPILSGDSYHLHSLSTHLEFAVEGSRMSWFRLRFGGYDVWEPQEVCQEEEMPWKTSVWCGFMACFFISLFFLRIEQTMLHSYVCWLELEASQFRQQDLGLRWWHAWLFGQAGPKPHWCCEDNIESYHGRFFKYLYGCHVDKTDRTTNTWNIHKYWQGCTAKHVVSVERPLSSLLSFVKPSAAQASATNIFCMLIIKIRDSTFAIQKLHCNHLHAFARCCWILSLFYWNAQQVAWIWPDLMNWQFSLSLSRVSLSLFFPEPSLGSPIGVKYWGLEEQLTESIQRTT